MAISTIDGVRGISPVHQDLAHSLRLSRRQRITKFAQPTALPKVMIALRLSLSGALVLAIVAEIVGDPAGIGFVVEISTQVSGLGKLMETAQRNFQSAQVYGLVVVVGLLALMINTIVTVAENFLLRYRPRA